MVQTGVTQIGVMQTGVVQTAVKQKSSAPLIWATLPARN